MGQACRTLDRLVADGRIAADWVPALRAVDAHIDSRIDVCLAKVATAGPYLPHELERNEVVWRAYELPLARVRVLLLGQDPYPDAVRATGLSFSTGPAGDVTRSLANIYEELDRAGYPVPTTGDLTAWTSQGVMLLNRALTLPRDKDSAPRRHIRWWSPITVATMKAIRTEAATRPVAALLWGMPALAMRKHLQPAVEVFGSSHPSPISARRTAGSWQAFQGSSPFDAVNRWFRDRNVPEIDWTLADV